MLMDYEAHHHVHPMTHDYSVVISTLLNVNTPIFKLGLHFRVKYSSVKFND